MRCALWPARPQCVCMCNERFFLFNWPVKSVHIQARNGGLTPTDRAPGVHAGTPSQPSRVAFASLHSSPCTSPRTATQHPQPCAPACSQQQCQHRVPLSLPLLRRCWPPAAAALAPALLHRLRVNVAQALRAAWRPWRWPPPVELTATASARTAQRPLRCPSPLPLPRCDARPACLATLWCPRCVHSHRARAAAPETSGGHQLVPPRLPGRFRARPVRRRPAQG